MVQLEPFSKQISFNLISEIFHFENYVKLVKFLTDSNYLSRYIKFGEK